MGMVLTIASLRETIYPRLDQAQTQAIPPDFAVQVRVALEREPSKLTAKV